MSLLLEASDGSAPRVPIVTTQGATFKKYRHLHVSYMSFKLNLVWIFYSPRHDNHEVLLTASCLICDCLDCM